MSIGRKPLLNSEMAEQIVATLRLGLTIGDACAEAGVCEKSYQNWYNRGERASNATKPKPEDQSLYIPFFRLCKSARSEGKKNLVNELHLIALNRQHPKQCAALQFLLERCHAKEFGRRSIRMEFDEPLTLDTPGGSVPSATCNIIVEGGPVPDAGPIVDEPEEIP